MCACVLCSFLGEGVEGGGESGQGVVERIRDGERQKRGPNTARLTSSSLYI